jgi:hypothetical protein
MRLAKILLTVIMVIFVLGGAVYFNGQYEDYCHMMRIASLDQVEWDLEQIGFWRQNQTAINFFIIVSILLNLGIAGAHAGEKKAKIKKNQKWHPRITLPGAETIQALKGNKV